MLDMSWAQLYEWSAHMSLMFSIGPLTRVIGPQELLQASELNLPVLRMLQSWEQAEPFLFYPRGKEVKQA